jgi:D-alanyl-D-alanine carboxypeptidase
MSKKTTETEPILHDVIHMTEPEGLLLGNHLEPILKNTEPAHLPVLRQLGIALGLLLFVFLTSYAGTLFALFSSESSVADDTQVSAKIVEDTPEIATINPFDSVNLIGKAGFVWDVREQKILFNKNADMVLPLASITKLMTALVAYELLEDESTIDITLEAIKADGDSGLTDGEIFSLKNLSDLVLIASSNDGAMALAEAAGDTIEGAVNPDELFVHAMNIRADELGLTETSFKNPTGLDVSPTEPGAVSSARDIAHLLEYIITNYPSITNFTKLDQKRVYAETGEYFDIENTNSIVNDVGNLIASKTGYTDLAGGNLVIAFDAAFNRPIVVVVLGSSYNGRFSDIKALTAASVNFIGANAP